MRKSLPSCIYKTSMAVKSMTCAVLYKDVGKQDFIYPSSVEHSSAISN